MSLFLFVAFFLQNCPCNFSYNIHSAHTIALDVLNDCSALLSTFPHAPSANLQVSELLLKLNLYQNPFPVHLIGLQQMDKFPGTIDIRKFTSYCKLAIVFLEGDLTNFATVFLNLLTPREYPYLKRDEDFCIILPKSTGKEEAHKILLTHISHEFKYKLVLSPDSITTAYTHCLYCEGGTTTTAGILELSLSEKHNLFTDFTKNFQGHLLRVVGPTKYVSVIELEQVFPNGSYRFKRGFYTELFFAVQRKLNFTYTVRPCSGFENLVPEGNTGTLMSSGQWAGCVADIYYNWADLSVGGSPDENRFKVVEFTVPLRYVYITFFTHKPRAFYPWTSVFLAFDLNGWILIILSILLAAGALNKMEYIMQGHSPLFSSILVYLFGYLVGQDLVVNVKSAAAKITFILWLFYGIVVGATYACSLQSLIVSPGIIVPPERMEELLNSRDYQWGSPSSFKNGLGEEIFKHSTNPVLRQLYGAMQEDNNAIDCLERAAITEYACFHWDLMAEFYWFTVFIDKTGSHPFLTARDNVLFSSAPWMTRKKEIFRKGINDFISNAQEMGIVHKAFTRDGLAVRRKMLEQARLEKKGKLTSYKVVDNGPKSFSFENVQGCFIVLAFGLVAASGFFTKELIISFYLCIKRRRNL